MKRTCSILLLLFFTRIFVSAPACFAADQEADTVPEQTRCTVCGMFVAKYPNWLTRIQYDDPSQTRYFDGVKDMMVYYFNPEKFEGPPRDAISNMFVKDYYTLAWIPAKEAFYVAGSDVYGPMGHELIPFADKEAAASFSRDHHGKKILPFNAITPELIDSLRAGQRMR